jgi:tight adherence protein B
MLPAPVLITFLLVAGIIGAAYYFLVLKPEEDEQRALRRRLKTGSVTAPRAASSPDGLLRTETPLSQIPVVKAPLGAFTGVVQPLQRLIDRSGLSLTVGALILMCLVSAIGAFLLVQTLSRLTLAAAVFAGAAAFIPIWFVNFKARSRIAKFEEQFPEAIDLLARALRAGHAFTTGLSMVAEELPDPVGTEFRLAYDRQNFGMPMPDALKQLGERVPLLDARFFVTAVLTQREAGGNLSEVLDNLASVIRERFKVKRQVRVITAHARITGWVLALLPPSLGVVLTLLAPDHMSLLWTHPTGIRMVVVALILQVVGTLIIRKLVDVEY